MDSGTEIYNLQRFINAQESTFDAVQAELAAGLKRTHWMWFIFPQIRGLESSPIAQRFAISSAEEAAAYLERPILGRRLEQYPALVSSLNDRSVEDVFGYPDNLKFHSSLTLFATVTAECDFDSPSFNLALARFFLGRPDQNTLNLLSAV